jgi:hypothetical protein
MTILSQPLHTFKDGATFVAATIDNGQLVIAQARNEEAAAEGKYPQLITVMNLTDAIALAKALLASQAIEDEAYDAFIEKEWERYQDHLMMVDDAIEHDYAWIRQGC